MNRSTLDALLMAKYKLMRAKPDCHSHNRIKSSTGISDLQDVLEHVIITCLTKKGIYQDASFEKLLNIVNKDIVPIPDLIRVQGLNKARVGCKHYLTTFDRYLAKEFFEVAHEATNLIVFEVFGKRLNEIFAVDLIEDPEIKEYLLKSCSLLEQQPFNGYECLLSIRKAIFLAFEASYCIEKYTDENPSPFQYFVDLSWAPFETQSKEWVEENVREVFQYIHIDSTHLKMRLLEYGISIRDFQSVLNLTPRVYRSKKTKQWLCDEENCYVVSNKEDVEYCLGVTIDAILHKENHYRLHRYCPKPIKTKFVTNQDTSIYTKSCVKSRIQRKIKKGEEFSTGRTAFPGLDEKTLFVKVSEAKKYDGKMEYIDGYILEEHGTFPELKENSV